MERSWIYRPRDDHASRALADRIAVHPFAAQVLLNRGVACPDEARVFLKPELRHLHDPFLFRDMARAAERVCSAVKRGEPIFIFGDYDVDGLTGTAVLSRLVKLMGGRVVSVVPERDQGYGLAPERVAAAAADGARVIVAVDNGTTAFAAAGAAQAAGVDLIVADHHLPETAPGEASAPRLPGVFAMLNPALPGETYPFPSICGAAVAFKLAWGMATLLSPGRRVLPEFREYLLDALALVAIGTIADMVPLRGENRSIVRFGLRALEATRDPGLRALLRVARIEGSPGPDDIAFRIGPRLNAAGRMGAARMALELFEARDPAQAEAIAAKLDQANQRRQSVERAVLAEALEDAPCALEEAQGRAVVLAREGWPIGVMGIVASRLVERFYRPSILIALAGAEGRGSARSVPGIALPDVLARCRAHLLRFGGHAGAAGLEIRREEVGPFRSRIGAVLAESPPPAHAAPPLEIDLAVDLPSLTTLLVRELEGLAPHGRGNEPPLFAAADVELAAAPRAVGRTGDHLQLLLRQGRTVVRGIGFGLGGRLRELSSERAAIDVAFRPTISRFTGEDAVELEVRDVLIRERTLAAAPCVSRR